MLPRAHIPLWQPEKNQKAQDTLDHHTNTLKPKWCKREPGSRAPHSVDHNYHEWRYNDPSAHLQSKVEGINRIFLQHLTNSRYNWHRQGFLVTPPYQRPHEKIPKQPGRTHSQIPGKVVRSSATERMGEPVTLRFLVNLPFQLNQMAESASPEGTSDTSLMLKS